MEGDLGEALEGLGFVELDGEGVVDWQGHEFGGALFDLGFGGDVLLHGLLIFIGKDIVKTTRKGIIIKSSSDLIVII